MNSRWINLLIVGFSILLSVAALEVGARLYYKYIIEVPTRKELLQYASLGLKNNHIRDAINTRTGHKYDPGKYYFSKYSFNNGGARVLVQGDSWMELLDNSGGVQDSLKNSSKVSLLVNGGTSSYAPSLMEMQFNDIMEMTGEKFDLVVAYIDQTDFMDEVCRYNKLRIEGSDGDLLAVLKTPVEDLKGYSSFRHLPLSAIEASQSKLLAMATNAVIGRLYIPKLMDSYPTIGCGWSEIERFMYGKISDEDVHIFKKNILSLVRNYQNHGARVVLLTHRHRRHFEEIYSKEIFDYAKDAIRGQKNVEVIELTEMKKELYPRDHLDQVFPTHDQDPASHPSLLFFKDHIAPMISEIIQSRVPINQTFNH